MDMAAKAGFDSELGLKPERAQAIWAQAIIEARSISCK